MQYKENCKNNDDTIYIYSEIEKKTNNYKLAQSKGHHTL